MRIFDQVAMFRLYFREHTFREKEKSCYETVCVVFVPYNCKMYGWKTADYRTPSHR